MKPRDQRFWRLSLGLFLLLVAWYTIKNISASLGDNKWTRSFVGDAARGHVAGTSAHVNCSKIFAGDSEEIRKARRIKETPRISDRDFVHLTSDCKSYRSRGYRTGSVSLEEDRFPLAYSIQIYKDLIQVERLLVAIYRPHNSYCVNVDVTAHVAVHVGMTAIATCFNNIYVTNVDVTWSKFSQVEADLACMKLLYEKDKRWKYLMTLSGQMYPLKTNLDLVRILRSLNGSNAVEASLKQARLVKERWDFLSPPPLNITIVKGGSHFAVTRAFVRYVLYDVRAALFLNWTRLTYYPDEHFFQSLSHNAHLEVPGAYTGEPEVGVDGYAAINRYVIWSYEGRRCHGVYVRAVCVFGVGDLHQMAAARHLFANKFYYDRQPMALRCLERRHRQWTTEDLLGLDTARINLTFYRNLPNANRHVASGLERH